MADKKQKEDWKEFLKNLKLPWPLKLLIGLAGVIAIYKLTPFWEIMTLFFYIVLVPLMLMVSIGLVSESTIEGFRAGYNKFKDTAEDVKERVDKKVAEAEAAVNKGNDEAPQPQPTPSTIRQPLPPAHSA